MTANPAERNLYGSWSSGSPTRKVPSALFLEDDGEGGEISTPRARSVAASSSSNQGSTSSRLRSEHTHFNSQRISSSDLSSDDTIGEGGVEELRKGRDLGRRSDVSSEVLAVNGLSDRNSINISTSSSRLSGLREPGSDSNSNQLGLKSTILNK